MKWDKINIEENCELNFDYDSFRNELLNRGFFTAKKLLSKDIKRISEKAKNLYMIELDFTDMIDIVLVFISLCGKGFHKNGLSFVVEKKSSRVIQNKISLLLNLVSSSSLNVNWMKFICTIEFYSSPVCDVRETFRLIKSELELIVILKTILENLKNAKIVSSIEKKQVGPTELKSNIKKILSEIELPTIVSGRVKNALWNAGISNMLDLYDYPNKLKDLKRVGDGNTVFFLKKYVNEKFPNLTFYCLED